MFQYTTAISKMRAMKARKKAVQGGTSSGKTHGIIPLGIDFAARTPRQKLTIVAESIPAVKDGAVKIFKDVMFETGRWVEERWIGNPMEYTFANGSLIQFKSFDSIGKAKASGKRDWLFLNECNHIAYEIADALMIRSKETWLDFNPDNEFWVHTEVLQEPNSELLILTFKDNEALPKETYEDLMIKISKAYQDPNADWKDPKNIKSDYWANWCQVYVRGEIGSLQGTIFQFKVVETIPPNAQLIAYGLDWGFSSDPVALGAVYKLDNDLFLQSLIYDKNLLNRELITKMKELHVRTDVPIVADSAEPKSIAELQQNGFSNTEPAQKGPDSIKFGIDRLQSFNLHILASSRDWIKEGRKYAWADKHAIGEARKPIKGFNHHWDGARYVAINRLGGNSGEYNVG